MKTSLHRILTKDGLWLDGLFFEPKRKTNRAVIWLHGISGNFYGGGKRIKTLAEVCTENNFAFISFNTRGAGVMSRYNKKKGKKTIGGGLEKFTESVWDIEAMRRFLQRRGIKKIFLIGHSTGANKSLYYMYKKRDRRITGLGLVGPMNDYAGKKQELGRRYVSIINKVKFFAKKEPDKLLPYSLSPIPTTAARYLSLYTQSTAEDVFPYYKKKLSLRS